MIIDFRFYDVDHQYKHLRRDHYFCQICDEDGANNIFYKYFFVYAFDYRPFANTYI